MKKLVLENEYLEVGILQKGAELCSLVDKQDGVEHMWKADPAFWPRHAPILFPCVGESKEGKITVDGTEYPMGRHGFARHEHFAVVSQEKNKAVLELSKVSFLVIKSYFYGTRKCDKTNARNLDSLKD